MDILRKEEKLPHIQSLDTKEIIKQGNSTVKLHHNIVKPLTNNIQQTLAAAAMLEIKHHIVNIKIQHRNQTPNRILITLRLLNKLEISIDKSNMLKITAKKPMIKTTTKKIHITKKILEHRIIKPTIMIL